MSFNLKLWGVRGSIACPLPSHMKYGGNTSCIEVTVGERTFVMDAGTGIRGLGQELIKKEPFELTMLLTHTHWDHVNGFPFFIPAYNPQWSINIKAGHLSDQGGIRSILSSQMESPLFPVPLAAMQSKLTFEDFRAGEEFDIFPGVHIRTAPLNHPNEATGYRIEYDGRVACYVTDTEHVAGEIDKNILGLIEGADVVLYDSTYTVEEYPSKVGWGHSTWNEGMRLCQEAGAKKLAIFHHDPDHDDVFMDGLEAEAKEAWSGNFVTREGMVIKV
jgi:phosphoribosyl 1,2-cyclic phosphodiesterase